MKTNTDEVCVRLHVLPGGALPQRMTQHAIGYDVRLRAVVSAHEMEPANPSFRRTLFDFGTTTDPSVKGFIEINHCVECGGKHAFYRLDPGAMALCGIGFVTEMSFPVCFLVLPRSGLASKHHVIVANAPGTVDPDYRGEAGVILYNCGTKPFFLHQGMRIAQILFTAALIPSFEVMASLGDMDATPRGSGGFGSTGLH